MGVVLKHYDKTGGAQITGKSWADAYAGVTQVAEKFWVQNVGDRASSALSLAVVQVGSNDGSSMIRVGLDTASLSCPYTLTAALSAAGAGGTWAATGTYYYTVTAYNATGETIGSLEAYAVVDVVTKKVVLTWTAITGATGYKVYRSTTSGSYGASSLRATVAGSNTYTDSGAATTTGTPPSTNTTGGVAPNYGTAPTLSTGPLALGILNIGQMVAYWVNRVVPSGTAEASNPRQSLRQFTES